MSDNKSTGGIGFTSLLLLAFIILKLTKTIDWTWWWVLSPLWIPLTIAGFILAIYGAILMWEHKRKKSESSEPPKSKWQERLEEIQREERAKREKNKIA